MRLSKLTFITGLSLALAAFAPSVRAADVAFFGIIKSQEYVQTNASAPVARATNGFAFNALVLANTNNVVTNCTVKPSNATPLRALVSTNADQVFWRFEERFNTQTALDATYPNGSFISQVNYAVAMSTKHDGLKSVNLNYNLLPLVGGQPAVPQITNFAAAQVIDHTSDFHLRFTPSGNAVIDLVQVVILDLASNIVFASPAPFSAGALTGASNSVVIPRNTLPPGQALIGHLAFVRPTFLETNAYPGAIGVPAVLRDTEFPLLTRPAPPAPQLTLLSAEINPVILGFSGEANRTYVLLGSTNLTSWVELAVTSSPTGHGRFTNQPAAGALRQFYRLRVGD